MGFAFAFAFAFAFPLLRMGGRVSVVHSRGRDATEVRHDRGRAEVGLLFSDLDEGQKDEVVGKARQGKARQPA